MFLMFNLEYNTQSCFSTLSLVCHGAQYFILVLHAWHSKKWTDPSKRNLHLLNFAKKSEWFILPYSIHFSCMSEETYALQSGQTFTLQTQTQTTTQFKITQIMYPNSKVYVHHFLLLAGNWNRLTLDMYAI